MCIGTCAGGPIEPTIGWQTDSMELVAVDYPVSLFVSIFRPGSKSTPSMTHTHRATARCEGVVFDIQAATDTTGPREQTRITVRPQAAAYFDIVVDVDDLDSGESYQRSFAFESGVPEAISIEVLPGPGATRRDGGAHHGAHRGLGDAIAAADASAVAAPGPVRTFMNLSWGHSE